LRWVFFFFVSCCCCRVTQIKTLVYSTPFHIPVGEYKCCGGG
jgi:hypothetical protein